jgi:hypothetical protein
MATRLAKPLPQSKIKRPVLPHEWSQLLAVAITKAERQNDPRLAGLRKGLEKGQAERVLRRLGIACREDLQRVFPEPKP